MSTVARAIGVSRPHLSTSSRRQVELPRLRSFPHDEELLTDLRRLVEKRPSYGYRRAASRLSTAERRINHKRAYRVMKSNGLLLPRHTGRSVRVHDGKVMTLKSNVRFCSDTFELKSSDGERVHVAFVLDCCDREVVAWSAHARHIVGDDVRNLMAETVEARFRDTRTPHPVEWLTDNGPPYTATETRAFGAACGHLVRNTPAYSPESNGMAEAFVKAFKRDYAWVADYDVLASPSTLLAALPAWFEDYNEHHPHKALRMLRPREFRRREAA